MKISMHGCLWKQPALRGDIHDLCHAPGCFGGGATAGAGEAIITSPPNIIASIRLAGFDPPRADHSFDRAIESSRPQPNLCAVARLDVLHDGIPVQRLAGEGE